jgi:hypothetical protein
MHLYGSQEVFKMFSLLQKYKGLDPENASDTGVDNNIYPRPTIFFHLD